MFGESKFHQFLYGRHFLIYSDHKPLIHIFSEEKSDPAMASANLQRQALTLSAYQCSIKYWKGDLMLMYVVDYSGTSFNQTCWGQTLFIALENP